jgi:hypothetical protein
MKPIKEFTPGPWRACCADTKAHYVFAEECEATICMPMHNDPDLPEYEPLVGTVTMRQRRANAALISAAPDLLEACQDVLEVAAEHLPQSTKKDLERAIAKALKQS